MKLKHQRLLFILLSIIAGSVALYLILSSLSENLLYYHTPSQVLGNPPPAGSVFKLGGIVKKDTLIKKEAGYSFTVTDNEYDIKVTYKGILPDLFKETQGVIATGAFDKHDVFVASEILAKHDENYMPPNVKPETQNTPPTM